MSRRKKSKTAPKTSQKAQKPAPQPIEAPLSAQIITAPRRFGQQLLQAETVSWQYILVVLVAAVLSGVAYAVLLRPGLNEAAAETLKAAGQSGGAMPTFLSHVTNAFGSFFLTILGALAMWGMATLLMRSEQTAWPKIAEVVSASFTLLIPLYLLVSGVVVATPTEIWMLDQAAIDQADGKLLSLQRAALVVAAGTVAAKLLLLVSLVGPLVQGWLIGQALSVSSSKGLVAGLLSAVPAVLLQVVGLAPLLLVGS